MPERHQGPRREQIFLALKALAVTLPFVALLALALLVAATNLQTLDHSDQHTPFSYAFLDALEVL